jgi:branched-chain amino acid transport system ATP-binding protein
MQGPRNALQVRHLTGGYDRRVVIADVDFGIDPGEVTLVVGPNGSGKSTVLRGILGLLPSCDGQVFFEGRRLSEPTHALRRLGLAYVPQRRPVFGALTVRRNLALASACLPRDRRGHQLDLVLDRFPALGERLGQRASTLSGGERQQLGLACALVAAPRVLLADEPTAGLSPALHDQLLRDLRATAKDWGLAVLLVEHNVANASRYADHVIGLRLGRIEVACPVAQFDEAAPRRVFLK